MSQRSQLLGNLVSIRSVRYLRDRITNIDYQIIHNVYLTLKSKLIEIYIDECILVGERQSGRRESHNVLENISEVDSQTGSNISGGGMSKKDSADFHKYEVDSAVAAISSMFPTVEENTIRDLLKK